MAFPAFFDEVPPLTLRDPLAELGLPPGPSIEYRFADAVRPCRAFLPDRRRCLADDDGRCAPHLAAVPRTGAVSDVAFGIVRAGVTGVIASIATLC